MVQFDFSKVNFYMDIEDLKQAIEDPEEALNDSLCVRKINGFRSCFYKNKEIKLTPRQFEALFAMAKDPCISHKLVTKNGPNAAEPETEYKIAERIRDSFEEAGFSRDIIIKIRSVAGYKINTEIIPVNRILAEEK